MFALIRTYEGLSVENRDEATRKANESLRTILKQSPGFVSYELLKQDGTLTIVGLPEKPPSIDIFQLISKRIAVAGSMIGGMPETQEMLDYCGENNITADVEVIPIDKVNEAFERMLKQDVKYRFVIDMSSLK